MALSHSVRALLPLKSLIKKVIENLGIDSKKLKFVSSSTVYENNKESKVVATIPKTTPASKHIAVNYHWFRHNIGKEFVIRKIESENQKADIFTKGLQGQIFVRIKKIAMRLVSLQMRGSVERNYIFSLIWRCYGPK